MDWLGPMPGLSSPLRSPASACHFFVKQVCQLALCEQGIGGDEFAFNLDAIEQGREHADFVGLFLLATARYGQRANFFWV